MFLLSRTGSDGRKMTGLVGKHPMTNFTQNCPKYVMECESRSWVSLVQRITSVKNPTVVQKCLYNETINQLLSGSVKKYKLEESGHD